MEQALENRLLTAAVAGLTTLVSVLTKIFYDLTKDLREHDETLSDKISNISLMIAQNYVPKDDFEKALIRIDNKLDSIYNKLDKKEDRR